MTQPHPRERQRLVWKQCRHRPELMGPVCRNHWYDVEPTFYEPDGQPSFSALLGWCTKCLETARVGTWR